MRLSARNQFKGTVTAVKLGTVMAEVTVDIGGGHQMVSAITRESADQLGLRDGASVTVIVKATEVLVAMEWSRAWGVRIAAAAPILHQLRPLDLARRE
jgi:molybdopterin-binding protein